jgi:hypothetical protein
MAHRSPPIYRCVYATTPPIGDLIESVMQVAVVRDVELKAHIEPYCPLHALLNCPNNIDRGNLCRERCSRRMTPLCGWRAN